MEAESERKKDVGFYLKGINEKLEKNANAELRQNDLTWSQMLVMVYLHHHIDKNIVQKDIETAFNVSHPAITGLLTRLEKKGLVQTKIATAGIRAKTIRLTEKGLQMLQRARGSREKMENRMLKGFSDDERNSLVSMLQRILANLNE